MRGDRRHGTGTGIQGWKIRVTRRLNRLWRSKGTIWDDRYHSQIIKNLKQVRNTLLYELCHHVFGTKNAVDQGWYRLLCL